MKKKVCVIAAVLSALTMILLFAAKARRGI